MMDLLREEVVRQEDNDTHDVLEENIVDTEKLIDESESNANAKTLDEQKLALRI